jgi:hypothetical protein
MKRLTTTAFLLLAFTLTSYSQVVIFGFNVTGGPGGGWEEQNGITAKASTSRFFDFMTYESNGESFTYTFLAKEGNALKYSRVSRELTKEFGKEDVNDDYIPEGAEDDEQYLANLVKLGRAEILRMWTEENHNLEISFIWSSEVFSVNFKVTPK